MYCIAMTGESCARGCQEPIARSTPAQISTASNSPTQGFKPGCVVCVPLLDTVCLSPTPQEGRTTEVCQSEVAEFRRNHELSSKYVWHGNSNDTICSLLNWWFGVVLRASHWSIAALRFSTHVGQSLHLMKRRRRRSERGTHETSKPLHYKDLRSLRPTPSLKWDLIPETPAALLEALPNTSHAFLPSVVLARNQRRIALS